MAIKILIISYIVICTANLFYTIKERKALDSLGELIIISFFSIFPLLNLLVTLALISDVFDKQANKYKSKLENNKLLEKMNEFVECDSCKIIIRKGYIKESTCPVCEKKSTMNIYKENYIPSNDIYFQKQILNLEQFEQDNLIEKTKEQNELYLSIMQKKLSDKKEEK